MARLKPCPFEGSVRITEASHGRKAVVAQRSQGLVRLKDIATRALTRLKGIGDCDGERAMVGAVGPPRW